jgi:alpha-tubulin suppressor-like RCC1 family protein
MKVRLFLPLGLCLLLSACGMLRIDVDYGWTPQASGSQTAQITATPTLKPATPSPSASPAQSSMVDTQTPTPTATVRPVLKAVAISAGEKHTCVVTNAGYVNCWGNNEHGQLGDGTMVNSNVPVEVQGMYNVAAVAAGWAHTCVLTRAGGVKCWGYNQNGELGNGKTADSSTPVEVSGLATGVVSIGTNEDHTCAVTSDGAVLCWGLNKFGQLGDGTRTSRSVPVEVQGLDGKAGRVAAGWGHTCVLAAAGGVQCWGNNEYGQLGYGQESSERLTPVMVLDLQSGVIGISAAGGQTCALILGGAVRCWGNNKYGQLGDGTGEIRRSPVAIESLGQGVAKVVTGWNHTCAVMGNGEVKCWGWNYYGQLGDETKTTRSQPVNVRRLMEDAADIAPGWAHTCATTAAGGVKCWGRNESGQLGDGTNIDSIVPLAVAGLVPTNLPSMNKATPTGSLIPGRALAISISQYHTCALTTLHKLKCWGSNGSGQLGNGSVFSSPSPTPVSGLNAGVNVVAAGEFHTCAIGTGNEVWCWGSNDFGQLGNLLPGVDQLFPVDALMADGMGIIRALAIGREHTCGLTDNHEVRCWGSDRYGQRGDGANPEIPGFLDGLGMDVMAISAKDFSTCAVIIGGAVKCWGKNGFGELGDGTTTDRDSPVAVRGLSSGVIAVSVGYDHACALMNSGGVKCWGNNRFGQLGDGTTTDSLTPVDVAESAGDFVELQSGRFFTCGRTQSGQVRCWGTGMGFTDNGLPCSPNGICMKPVEAQVLKERAVSLAVGELYICVIVESGKILCWGDNTFGQLGDGTNQHQDQPVEVIGL